MQNLIRMALGAALMVALAGAASAQHMRHWSPDTVREAQRMLNQLGFNAGDADGMMGGQTRAALIAFQRARGLNRTGELSQETLAALGMPPRDAVQRPPTARAEMRDAQGYSLGTVHFTEMPRGLVIRAELSGLPEGWHGFHIHAVGKCEPPFESAGGHFNPTRAQHGLGRTGTHAGDLPNIHADANGRVHVELFAPQLSLVAPQVASSGSPGGGIITRSESLLDGDGAAVLVHAQPDDYATDPSGHSGGRIACGVIAR